MADLTRLKTVLNNSRIQIDNNALYQVIDQILFYVTNIVGGVLPGPITIDVLIKSDNAQIVLQDEDSLSKGRIQVSLGGNRMSISQNVYTDPSGSFNLDDTAKSGWLISLTDSSGLNRTSINYTSPGSNPRTLNSFITVDSSGLLTANGSVLTPTLNVSAGHIQFPIAQNPSSGANVLDDYEEGIFVPVMISTVGGGATYNENTGKYTKIGNNVNFTGRITLSSKGTMSGSLSVGGLPFIPVAFSDVMITHFGSASVAISSLGGLILSGTSTYDMRYVPGGGATGISVLTGAQISNNFDFIFSGNYFTAT